MIFTLKEMPASPLPNANLKSTFLHTNRENIKKEEMIAEKNSNLLTLQKGNELNTPRKLTGKPDTLHLT